MTGRWWEDPGGRDVEPPGTEGRAPARTRPDRVLSTRPLPLPPPPPPPAPRPSDRGSGASRRRRFPLWVVLGVALALAGGVATFVVVTSSAPVPDAAVAARPPVGNIAPVEPSVPYGRDAPTIDAPRDLGATTRRPCSLLERSQANGLGYERWSTRTSPVGERNCTFVVDDPERTLVLTPLDGRDGSAFADLYRDERPPVFTPVEVGGLPAVLTQGYARSQLCRVTVGVADGQSLRADTEVPDDANDVPVTDPCARALKGAEAAVANLPRDR